MYRSPNSKAVPTTSPNIFQAAGEIAPTYEKAPNNNTRKPSSLNFVPQWEFHSPKEKPIKAKEIKVAKQSEPARTKNAGFKMPDLANVKKVQEAINLRKSSPADGSSASGSPNVSINQMQKVDSFEERDKKNNKALSHQHGGGEHGHNAVGNSLSGKKHKHSKRFMQSIQRAYSQGTPIQKYNLQKLDIYQLQEYAREIHEKSLQTGAPMNINGEQARDATQEVGITQDRPDSQPGSSSTFGSGFFR